MRDPDDTQPVIEEPEPPPLTLEQRVTLDLEENAETLAGWCGEWGLRGVPVDDLAGIVRLYGRNAVYGRRPFVMRRSTIDRRHPKLAQALRSVRRRPGRLDVAVVLGDHDYQLHSIGVPAVDVPDTRATLPTLSSEQRATIEGWIEESLVGRVAPAFRPPMLNHNVEDLFASLGTAVPGSVLRLRVGFLADTHEEKYRARIAEAGFQAEYGKLVVVVDPHEGLPGTVLWLDVARLGASPADWNGDARLPLL